MGNQGSQPRQRRIPIVTTDSLGPAPIRFGATLHGVAISGANVLRDLREAVTNTLGGKMIRYEKLLDQTIDRAIETIEERAIAAGYDAIVGLRISHPVITDGAIEVVVVGTGVWFESTQA
jgi:uncharacterized protein YbjQ (UPF0145 family)